MSGRLSWSAFTVGAIVGSVVSTVGIIVWSGVELTSERTVGSGVVTIEGSIVGSGVVVIVGGNVGTGIVSAAVAVGDWDSSISGGGGDGGMLVSISSGESGRDIWRGVPPHLRSRASAWPTCVANSMASLWFGSVAMTWR